MAEVVAPLPVGGRSHDRTLYIHTHPKDIDANEEFEFCDNAVISHKYNLFNFLPKNLWEQFQVRARLFSGI